MWQHVLSSLVHFRENSITAPSSVELHQDATHRLFPRDTSWEKQKLDPWKGVVG